jgi:hypothetical protein
MDMSMRSSGIQAMTPDNEPIGFEVITTTLDDFPDHEDTIIYIAYEVQRFIQQFQETPKDPFVIEGLSHGAQNASKDVICGIFWAVRTMVWTKFPEMPIGAVPVNSWRATVLDKADRKYAKENYSPKKEAIKIATVNKLPEHLLAVFTNYIELSGFDKKSIYDLADSYFLGVYRNKLNEI